MPMSEAVQFFTKEVVKELNKTIVVLDTETTGFSQYNDRIIEFGAIKLINGREVDSMSVLMNPQIPIPSSSSCVHGIVDSMVADKPTEQYYAPKIAEFISGADLIVGHNVAFDIRFLEQMFMRNGLVFNYKYLDTLKFSKKIFNRAPNHKLTTLAEYLGIEIKDAHRALADVETTVWLLRHLAYQVMKY